MRYASGGHVDGTVVAGGAFKPRPSDNGLLSVNRLGVFADEINADLKQLRLIVSQWMTVRKTGRFAQIAASVIGDVLNEAEVAFMLEDDKRKAEGKPDDPSHALVHGIPSGEDDGSIATRDMIAIKVSRLHEAVAPA